MLHSAYKSKKLCNTSSYNNENFDPVLVPDMSLLYSYNYVNEHDLLC